MKRIDTRFAERIRTKRKAKSLRQYQLANLVGIDPVYISQIETGRKVPTVPIAKRLAIELDDNVEDYIRWAALHRAQGDARKYFEPPSPRYPNLRGLLLTRCENKNEMESELGSHQFGFLERLIVHTLVVRTLEKLFVDTELKTDAGDEMSRLKDDILSSDTEPDESARFLETFGELSEHSADVFTVIEEKLKREYNIPGYHLLTLIFNTFVESWSFNLTTMELAVDSPHAPFSGTFAYQGSTESDLGMLTGLGRKLRECRTGQKMSLATLAKDVGVVSRSLEKLEDEKTDVDLEVLGKILAKLNVAPGIKTDGLLIEFQDHQYFKSYSELTRKSRREVDDFLSFKLQQERAQRKNKPSKDPRQKKK